MRENKFKETEIGTIPEEWEVDLLDNICSKITDGSHFSPKEDPNGEYKIATIKDFSSFGFNFDGCKRVSKKDFENLAKADCRPLKGDVLFSKDGTVGIVYVSKGEDKLVLLSSIAILRVNNKIDPYFLSHYLKNKRTQSLLKSGHISGSALPRIVLKDLKKLLVIVPPFPEQSSIASILGSLDDKIILNRQMNSTLESIGQALFARWFVDFEFPYGEGKPYRSSGGEMVETELGEVPRGWNLKKIGDIVAINEKSIDKQYKYDDIESIPSPAKYKK